MSELILCQREEITPVADAIRDLCAKHDGMNLVAMRANITNAAAAMHEQNELIGQISEVLGATASTDTPSIEGNTELLRDLLEIAEDAAGSVTLPELENEGTAAQLLKDKQLIDGDGNIVVGTAEPRDSNSLVVDNANGAITVPAGLYSQNARKTLSQPTYNISVENNHGEAKIKVGATNAGFTTTKTNVEVPIGAYHADVNFTFNDITATPHNIASGYVYNESSVQIAPAVIDEVDEQSDLIAQILYAVNELPEQTPPAVVAPLGNTMAVYDDGRSEILSNAEVLMTNKGSISSLSVDGQPLWERDENITDVLLHKQVHLFQAPNEEMIYINYPIVFTRAPIVGERAVVYINDIPYPGQYIDNDGQRMFASDSEQLFMFDMGVPDNYPGSIHLIQLFLENAEDMFASVAVYATAS